MKAKARAFGSYQKFASRDFLLTLTYLKVRNGKVVAA